MTRRRRILVVAGAAVAVVAILTLLAPGSGGISALQRFLSASGTPVQSGQVPPTGRGTFLLVIDRRTPEQETALLSWVSSGGRLVVTDPGSSLFARFGITGSRAAVFGTATLATGCVRPETLGVDQVEVAATDQLLSTSAPSGSSCFVQGSAGYAVFMSRGSGEIVLAGGSSFLGDALLDHADNAVFAHDLLDSGGPVVFGPPTPPDATPVSLWALIPRNAKAVIWELAIAVVFFAFASGRRLGRPVPEAQISPIPSGELVRAAGRLYRLAGARAFCADALRRSTTERIARRLGLPPDPDRARQADAIALRLDTADPAVPTTLNGPDPANDEEFVALCRELERFADQIEGAER